MWRVTWKGLISHKLRLSLTALAIILGVGLVAGSFVFTDTLSNVFDDLFEEGFEDVDAVVRAEFDPDLSFALSGRIEDSLLEEVSQVEGVGIAAPSLGGFIQLIGPDDEPIGGTGAPTIASNHYIEAGPLTELQGRGPAGPGELALDESTATRNDIMVGDTLWVVSTGMPEQYEMVGTVGFGSSTNFGGAVFVTFTLPEVQRLLGEPNKLDAINIAATDGYSVDQLLINLDGFLPEGVEAVDGDTAAEEQIEAFQDALSFINTFLLVFGIVALFVGAFIIQNTFQIVVAQRTRELGVLRALGASRRQITGMVISESLIVSFLSSLVGIGVGVGLAFLLQLGLEALGGDLPSGTLQVAPRTVIVALIAGMTITFISALVPALKAGRIPPIAAMREGSQPPTARSLQRRTIVGIIFIGLGAGAGALALWGTPPEAIPEIALVGIGAGVMFLGIAVLGPTFARPLSRFIGFPLTRLFGVPGKLAKENASRSPRRTSATAAALMVGVALASLVTIMASSFEKVTAELIDDRFRADVIIETSGFGGGAGLAAGVANSVEALPEVDTITRIRIGQAKVDESTTFITGADLDTINSSFSYNVLEGSFQDVGPDEVVINSGIADSDGIKIGDAVPFTFNSSGDQLLTVAAIFEEAADGSTYILDISGWDANFVERFDQSVYVNFTEGVDPTAGRAALETATDPFGAVSIQDQTEFKEETTGDLNAFLNLIYALLGLTLVIAVFGIANTLLLSVIERTREIGLLRAVGSTRRQLRRMITWESVIIAIFGAILGIATGILFGWAIIGAIDISFSLPWVRLVITMLAAGLAGVVAAFFPARRAAKMNVLEAISYE